MRKHHLDQTQDNTNRHKHRAASAAVWELWMIAESTRHQKLSMMCACTTFVHAPLPLDAFLAALVHCIALNPFWTGQLLPGRIASVAVRELRHCVPILGISPSSTAGLHRL
jgi:hypothetical protein